MTTETEKLMIRGDRLLLLLDVLRFMDACCRVTGCVHAERRATEYASRANPHRLTRTSVLRILASRFGYAPAEHSPTAGCLCGSLIRDSVPALFLGGWGGEIDGWLRFISLNETVIRRTGLWDVTEIINYLPYPGGDAPKIVSGLFRAVASGELTEADFKE